MPNQFANDSMTPAPITVKRNQYDDEIPTSDPTNHENATPQHSSPMYTGNHYAPVMKYGVDVAPPSGVKTSMIDADANKRGAE